MNLENSWRFNRHSLVPTPLSSDVPHENKVLGDGMRWLQLNKNQPVILALNFHSSNSGANDPASFYPHFGSAEQYTDQQKNLGKRQTDFIRQVDLHYESPIQSPPGEGFLTYYPETWWWHNKKDEVNAITLETAYGRAGLGHWITPENYRKLGKAIAEAIAGSDPVSSAHSRPRRSSMLTWIACKGAR